MEFPEDLYYSKDHEWLRLEEDGKTGVVGVTEFAQQELGDVVFVELEDEGTELAQDEVFGTIEAVKTVSELFAPVGGTLIALNPDLDGSPEKVNEDPYGEGWMVKISISDLAELDTLLRASDYAEMVDA